MIDDDKEGIKILGAREISDEVDGYNIPGVVRYFVGCEQTSWFLAKRFVLLTGITALDLRQSILGEGGPPEITLDQLDGLGTPWMAGSLMSM